MRRAAAARSSLSAVLTRWSAAPGASEPDGVSGVRGQDGGWQTAVSCREVVFSGAAARVASGPGRGGALSWAGGAEGPSGAERDRWLGAWSGLGKARLWSALSRAGF